jgi:hypothetical protein
MPGEGRKIHLPMETWARIDILLYSELEGRVPYGSYKEFFEAAVNLYIAELAKGAKAT